MKPPYIIASLLGLAVWIGVAVAGGKTEAWDSPLYLTAAVPLLLLGSGVLGSLYPQLGWRCGALVATGHAVGSVAMGIVAGSGFTMLPLGLLVLAMIGVPLAVAAWLGGALRGFITG